VIVSWISTPIATWSTLVILLSIHLATNYAAVKSVSMRCLNRQRANIVLSNILQSGRVFSPADVSQKERVFERDGVLRWSDDTIIGHCKIGVTMQTLVSLVGQRHEQTGSIDMSAMNMSDLLHLYEEEAYIFWKAQSDAVIILKQGCTPVDQLRAWTQALLFAQQERADCKPRDDASGGRLAELRSTLEKTQQVFDTFEARLRDVGWDLDIAALETRAGKRIEIDWKAKM
jgi:hypothetical protein